MHLTFSAMEIWFPKTHRYNSQYYQYVLWFKNCNFIINLEHIKMLKKSENNQERFIFVYIVFAQTLRFCRCFFAIDFINRDHNIIHTYVNEK